MVVPRQGGSQPLASVAQQELLTSHRRYLHLSSQGLLVASVLHLISVVG